MWTEWCAVQPSYADEVNPGLYGCLPNWGIAWDETGCHQDDPSTNMPVERDCVTASLCIFAMVCTCDATGCTVDDQPTISFDMELDGARLDGSVDGMKGVSNVHFTRQ